jgi:hypothetical protein
MLDLYLCLRIRLCKHVPERIHDCSIVVVFLWGLDSVAGMGAADADVRRWRCRKGLGSWSSGCTSGRLVRRGTWSQGPGGWQAPRRFGLPAGGAVPGRQESSKCCLWAISSYITLYLTLFERASWHLVNLEEYSRTRYGEPLMLHHLLGSQSLADAGNGNPSAHAAHTAFASDTMGANKVV